MSTNDSGGRKDFNPNELNEVKGQKKKSGDSSLPIKNAFKFSSESKGMKGDDQFGEKAGWKKLKQQFTRSSSTTNIEVSGPPEGLMGKSSSESDIDRVSKEQLSKEVEEGQYDREIAKTHLAGYIEAKSLSARRKINKEEYEKRIGVIREGMDQMGVNMDQFVQAYEAYNEHREKANTRAMSGKQFWGNKSKKVLLENLQQAYKELAKFTDKFKEQDVPPSLARLMADMFYRLVLKGIIACFVPG